MASPLTSLTSTAASGTASMGPRKITSRMDLLGRRDASRWGGLSDIEVEAREKEKKRQAEARKRLGQNDELEAGPPREEGAAPLGGSILHAHLTNLTRATRLAQDGKMNEARKLVERVHAALRGQAGLRTKSVSAEEVAEQQSRAFQTTDPTAPPRPPSPTRMRIDKELMAAAVSAREVAPELIIATGETAALLNDWPTVWSCLSLFQASAPTLSQYLLRSLLLQSRAEAIRATDDRNMKGEELAHSILTALTHCSQVIHLLTQHAKTLLPAYTFLLFNTAATVMVVARPLMREGFRSRLLEPLKVVAQGLENLIPPSSLESNPALESEIYRQTCLAAEEAAMLASSAAASNTNEKDKNANSANQALLTSTSDISLRYAQKAWSTLINKWGPTSPLSTRSAFLRLLIHVTLLRSGSVGNATKNLESIETDLEATSQSWKKSVVPGCRSIIALQKVRTITYANNASMAPAVVAATPTMTKEEMIESLKSCIDALTDPKAEEYDDEENEEGGAATVTTGSANAALTMKQQRRSDASGSSASSLNVPLTSKRRLKGRDDATNNNQEASSVAPTPRELALAELARAKAAEMARLEARRRKAERQRAAMDRLEIVAEIGWECFQNSNLSELDLAQKCCNAAIVSKRNGVHPAWLLAELLGVWLDIRRAEDQIVNFDGNPPSSDANSGTEGYSGMRGPVPVPNANGTHASSPTSLSIEDDPVGASMGLPLSAMQSRDQGLAARISGLKVLDQTLSSAARISKEAPEIMIQLVREGWNIARPLLQRDFTAAVPGVQKLLRRCSTVLGEATSPSSTSSSSSSSSSSNLFRPLSVVDTSLLELRALIHLELGFIEAKMGFMEKARRELEMATKIDYSISTETSMLRQGVLQQDAANNLARRWDQSLLEPTWHKHRIQSLSYVEPEWFINSAEDQARRCIEQARDIKVANLSPQATQLLAIHPRRAAEQMGSTRHHLKRSLLLRAIQLLDKPCFDALTSTGGLVPHMQMTNLDEDEDGSTADPTQSDDSSPSSMQYQQLTWTPLDERRRWSEPVVAKRVECWMDIARLAWEQGFLELVLPAVAHVMELTQPIPVAVTMVESTSDSNETVAGIQWNAQHHASIFLSQVEALDLQVRACVEWMKSLGFEPGYISTPIDSTANRSSPSPKLSISVVDDSGAHAPHMSSDNAAMESDPDSIARREAALFYQSKLNQSLLSQLDLTQSILTADRHAFINVNTCVRLSQVYERLFYEVSTQDSRDSQDLGSKSLSDAEDVRTTLQRCWQSLLDTSKRPSATVPRKPSLLAHLTLVLSRFHEMRQEWDACLTVLNAALTQLLPATASPCYTHPQHPAWNVLERRPLVECLIRATAKKPSSSSSATVPFTTVLSAVHSCINGLPDPALQIFAQLEFVRLPYAWFTGESSNSSGANSNTLIDEKRKVLMDAANSMQELSADLRGRLSMPLSVVNGDESMLVQDGAGALSSRTTEKRKSGGGSNPSTKKDRKSRDSGNKTASGLGGARASSASRKKKGSSRAADDASESNEPILTKLNTQAYSLYLRQLRELDTQLWTALAAAASAAPISSPLLAIQLAGHGLSSCPGFDGPKIDVGTGPLTLQASSSKDTAESHRRTSSDKFARGHGGSTKKARDKERLADLRAEKEAMDGTTTNSSPVGSARSTTSLDGSPSVAPESPSAVSPTRLFCYAHLCSIAGAATLQLLDPTRHDPGSQDTIRRRALDWFTFGVSYAARAIRINLAQEVRVRSASHLFPRAMWPQFDLHASATLLLVASRNFWNGCLPLSLESMTRSLIRANLKAILESMEEVVEALIKEAATTKIVELLHHASSDMQRGGGALAPGASATSASAAIHLLDPAFRTQLYMLYFDCLKDANMNQEGYQSSSRALRVLPAVHRKEIWKLRVQFMSALGLDVGAGILKVKGLTGSTTGEGAGAGAGSARVAQAQMWLGLARSCSADATESNLSQSFDFFVRALDGMEEAVVTGGFDSGSDAAAPPTPLTSPVLAHAEVLIEFGEFLYNNNFELRDARAHLHRAAALLMQDAPDLLKFEGEDDDEEQEGGGGGTVTFDETATRSGLASPTTGARSTAGGRGTATGLSSRRGLSPTTSRLGSPTAAGPHTMRGFDGKTHRTIATSRTLATEATGSATAGSTSTTTTRSELSLSHLFFLIRTYSLLSRCSSSSVERNKYSLVVASFVREVWSRIMRAVEGGFFGRPPLVDTKPPSSTNGAPTSSAPGSIVGGVGSPTLGSPAMTVRNMGATTGRSTTSAIPSPSRGRANSSASAPTGLAAALAAHVYTPAPEASSVAHISLPSTPEQWLRFHLDPKIKSWLFDGRTSSHGVWTHFVPSKHILNMEAVVLLWHGLKDEVVPMLIEAGFDLDALPCLLLLELLVSAEAGLDHPAPLSNRAAQSLLHLHLARLSNQLLDARSSLEWLARAEPLLPTPSEQLLLNSIIDKREQLNRAQKDGAEEEEKGPNAQALTTRHGGISSDDAASMITSTRSTYRVDTGRSATMTATTSAYTATSAGGRGFLSTQAMYSAEVLQSADSILADRIKQFHPSPKPIHGPDLNPRRIWNEMVELLLDAGRVAPAKTILRTHLRRSVEAWSNSDAESVSSFHRSLCRLACIEGQVSQAMHLALHADRSYFGQVQHWMHALSLRIRLVQASVWKRQEGLKSKFDLLSRARGLLLHARNTFQALLMGPRHASGRRELKEALARVYEMRAQIEAMHERVMHRGLGLEHDANPSTQPVSFAAATDMRSNGVDTEPTQTQAATTATGAATGQHVTRTGRATSTVHTAGFSRPPTSLSYIGSETGSQVVGPSGSAAPASLSSYLEPRTLANERQKLFEEEWAALEAAAIIYGAATQTDDGSDAAAAMTMSQALVPAGSAAPASSSNDDADIVSSLQDGPKLARVLILHAKSLLRYAELFAFPAAESMSSRKAATAGGSSAKEVLAREALQKVTQGAQALHKALLLAAQAEALISAQLLLVAPSSTTSLSGPINLPLQRRLREAQLLQARVMLDLYRYKHPLRALPPSVLAASVGASTAVFGGKDGAQGSAQAQILRLDQSPSSSSLTFSNAHDAVRRESLEVRMNNYFFARYASVFKSEDDALREAAEEARDHPEESFNMRAAQLAASAAGLDASFVQVLQEMEKEKTTIKEEKTGNKDDKQQQQQAASAATPIGVALLSPLSSSISSSPSAPSLAVRGLVDDPEPLLVLGRSLSSLARASFDARLAKQHEKEVREEQEREQQRWQEQVEKERARARSDKDAAVVEAQEQAEREEAEEAAAAVEAERQREEAARAQLLAEEAARREAEAAAAAEVAAQTSSSKRRSSSAKKKKSSNNLNHPMPNLNASSGEKHYNPPLSESKRAAGKQAAVDVESGDASRPTTAVSISELDVGLNAAAALNDEKADVSSWSPVLLHRWLRAQEINAREQKAREDEIAASTATNFAGKKKGGAAASPSKAAAANAPNGRRVSTPASTSPRPMDTTPVAISLASFGLPSFPSLHSLEGQAIAALQRSLDLAARRDMDTKSIQCLSEGSMELAGLFGTAYPIHTAKYLHLSCSARLHLLVRDLVLYASTHHNPEALVMQRVDELQESSPIPSSAEIERCRVYLKCYSKIWQAVSAYSTPFVSTNATASVTPENGGHRNGAASASEKTGDATSADDSKNSEASFASSCLSHGQAAFESQLSSLPPHVSTLLLHYDSNAQCLYSSLCSSDVSKTRVARSALSKDEGRELRWMLSHTDQLGQRIHRATILYGSRTNAQQLDALEKQYAWMLQRMETFFIRHVMEPLGLTVGCSSRDASIASISSSFSSRSLVLLLSSPTLWSLPFESMECFRSARSVSRDYSLNMLLERWNKATNAATASAMANAPTSSASINVQSVGYVVDAGGEDGNTLTEASIVGAQTVSMVTQARTAAEAASQAGAAQPAAVVAPVRPASGSRNSQQGVVGASKAKVPGTAASSAMTGTSSDPDALIQNDLVRVMNEVRAIIHTPGSLGSYSAGNATTNATASSVKESKESKDASKEAAAASAAIRAISPGWTGVSGDAHPPVLGEWMQLLTQAPAACGAFVYLGYEPLLTRVQPQQLLGLQGLSPLPPVLQAALAAHAPGGAGSVSGNLGVHALLLFDRAVNASSARVSSLSESNKSSLDRSLDSSFYTGLLPSLQGVLGVLCRTGACSGPANAASFKFVMEKMSWEGMGMGQAAHALHCAKLPGSAATVAMNIAAAKSSGLSASASTSSFTSSFDSRPNTSSVAGPSNTSAEPLDMLRYLDHAAWMASSTNASNNNTSSTSSLHSKSGAKERGSIRASGAGIGGSSASTGSISRPLAPTFVRTRAEKEAQQHAPESMTSLKSPLRSRRPSRASLGGSRNSSLKALTTARSTARSLAPNSSESVSALRLRLYDLSNLLCIGLPDLKLQ